MKKILNHFVLDKKTLYFWQNMINAKKYSVSVMPFCGICTEFQSIMDILRHGPILLDPTKPMKLPIHTQKDINKETFDPWRFILFWSIGAVFFTAS